MHHLQSNLIHNKGLAVWVIARVRLSTRLNVHWCAVDHTPQESQFFIKKY